MSSASRTTTGRMAASADRKGSSVRGRTLPRGRWVRPYAAWRRISALPGTTRYIEPATAPMMRPACPIATSRTSSRPNDELTADAIASKSAARSRAPLSSSRAPCSRRVMPRMRIRAIVSSTNAMMNSTEVTSRTDAISKYTLPGSGIRHRLTPGEARLVPGCRPGGQLYSVPTWSRSLSTTCPSAASGRPGGEPSRKLRSRCLAHWRATSPPSRSMSPTRAPASPHRRSWWPWRSGSERWTCPSHP